MVIYFLRHASAGRSLLDSNKDERRPLDEDGILQARYVGAMLANLDVQVEQIISSPLKRARQTATIVANELAFESAVQVDDALRPQAQLAQFQAMLLRLRKFEYVMMVGHNPSLNEFLSRTISAGAGVAKIDFKKASVAKVEIVGRKGTLDWLVTPKIARIVQAGRKISSRPKTSRK
jgi:phosphohistidine phosphatase